MQFLCSVGPEKIPMVSKGYGLAELAGETRAPRRVLTYNKYMASTPTKAPPLDIDQRLVQLDGKLESVRNLYEKYFSGVIKIEPAREHRDLKILLGAIPAADIKSTAAKFKHQSIQSRYLQLLKLWTKTLREIEEGIHKREIFLMEKNEEFKRLTHEQKQPDFIGASSKHCSRDAANDNYLAALYDKMSAAVAGKQALPSREGFIQKVGPQILDLKAKNPDKKVELRLQKNAQGKLEVKIKLQPKS